MNLLKLKYDKTLNNEELHKKAKAGDSEAKELLFKNNIPFVVRLVKRWKRNGSVEDFDELLSIGLVGLTKACNRYDPTKGCLFIGLVKLCVLNEFKNHAYQCSLERFTKYSPLFLDDKPDEDSDSYHDYISNPDTRNEYEEVFEGCFLEEVEQLVSKVGTPKEIEVFNKVYRKNMTPADIAKEMGVSREAPSQVHRNLIHDLKNMYKGKSA